MKLGVKVKEKIARTIGEYFTTNEIVNIFTDANITVDQALYAKWRITLDAFRKISTEKELFHIIEEFCHPLNFQDQTIRQSFIEKLNDILKYEFLDIVTTELTAKVVDLNNEDALKNISKAKTSTDYIVDAINFFKNEYNKVKMSGLTYEYSIGENVRSEQTDQDPEEYSAKLKAIETLNNVGLITEYKIEERVEAMGYYIWDYAICKIDESKLTQKEAPPATDAGVEALTKKVIHEHTHRFENSIQEKEISLSHKVVEDEVLVKNKKKIALPKFSATEWSKAEIRFITENDVYVKAGQKSATADYEGLGFRNDKTGKPNTAWRFLLELAKKSGETPKMKSPIPDNVKQQKRILSDRLKTIFKNDTDPFYDFSQTNTYKIKLKLLPPTDEKQSDSFGIDEYLNETMTSKYEPEE